MKIFSSADIDVLNDWENQLITPGGKYNLTDLQKIEFQKCILANAKTTAKNKQKYYEQIANLYFNTGQYEQAINFFNLYNFIATDEEKNRVLPKFLDSCLRMPNEKLVASLMEDYLKNNNISTDNPLILTIEKYFKDSNIIVGKNVIWKSLKEIPLSKQMPIWQAKLQQWNELINKTEPEPSVTKVTN